MPSGVNQGLRRIIQCPWVIDALVPAIEPLGMPAKVHGLKTWWMRAVYSEVQFFHQILGAFLLAAKAAALTGERTEAGQRFYVRQKSHYRQHGVVVMTTRH